MKKQKKPYLYVNENGFISIYALIMLSVLFMFMTLFISKINTYANVMNIHNSTKLDLLILQSVKEKLKNQEDTNSPDNNMEEEQVKKSDEENKWDLIMEDTSVHFSKDENEIDVSFLWKNVQKHVKIEIENNIIVDYAYV